MKRWWMILVLLICLVPMAAAASTPPVYSQADIEARLDALIDALDMKHFTTTGSGCNGSKYVSGHGCDTCMLTNVVGENSKFRTESGLTKWPSTPSLAHVNHGIWNNTYNTRHLSQKNYSCRAFANFVGWYLFSSKSTDSVSYYRLTECPLKEAYKYAKPGDIIATSGHSMVFVSGSETTLMVLDCNAEYGSYGQCLIRYRSKKLDGSMVTISRATNYAQRTNYTLLSTKTLDDHEYRLYSGFASWSEANQYVSTLGNGWHLASITSAQEQTLIANMASQWNGRWNGYGYGGMAWLGGRYVSGAWTWTTGEDFSYTNWQSSPGSSSSKPYLAIYGHTNTDSSYNTVKDKWGARATLSKWYKTGFVAEYTPPLENFKGRIYDLNATMTVIASEADIYSKPSTSSTFLRAAAGGETVHVIKLLVGEDGSRWCQLDTDAFISCNALQYFTADGNTSASGLLIPSAMQPYGMPFTYAGRVKSDDSILSVIVTLKNQSTGKTLTQSWNADPDDNLHEVSLSEIADTVTLLDLSAFDKGAYELTIQFCNALNMPVYTVRSPFNVQEGTCAHIETNCIIKEPTCTEAGINGSQCVICMRILTDRPTQTIAPYGHTAGEWVTVTEPDASSHGEEALYCSVCNEVMETRILPGEGFGLVAKKTDPSTGRTYILMSGSTSWTNARNYAASLGEGYTLACMDGSSSSEQAIIQGLVTDFGRACWLGGTCSGGSWEWVSGVGISTSDSRWASGQPSGTHSGSSEQYLGIYGDSAQTSYAEINKWNDFSLSSSTIKGFVIEYAPNIVKVPSHVTISVGESYAFLYNTTGVVSYQVIQGSENITISEEGGMPTLTANQAGATVLEFTGEDGSTAKMGVTIMPYTMYCEIYPSDDSWDGILSSDEDREFFLYILGPKPEFISDPTWRISDTAKAAVVGTDNGRVTLHALDNGAVTLEVSVDITMEDGYLNPVETWSAKLDLSAALVDTSEITCVVPDGTVEEKLAYLRTIFPDGWYFDLWDDSQTEDSIQYKINANGNVVGVSNKACDHTVCSKYWGYMRGTRATGYARVLYYLMWGHEPARDSFMYVYYPAQGDFDLLLHLAPGDLIYTGSHYYVVTKVSGESVYVTDCNNDGKCGIRWDAVYTLDELKAIIAASGVGRVYTPNAKPMPGDELLTEYAVLPGKTLTVYTHPFNDSRKLITLSAGSVFDVDLTHTYENTNASYGKGTWAHCYSAPECPAWVLISDTTVCEKNDLGDNFKEHLGVSAPIGVYDLETFRNDLLSGSYARYFSGLVSGMLVDAQVVIRPIHPITNELGPVTTQWSDLYSPEVRTSLDITASVRFSNNELYRFTEGVYSCETLIRYKKDGVVYEWFSLPSSTVFCLVASENAFPSSVSADSSAYETVTDISIPVSLGEDDFSLLYADIEVTSGASVGEVSWTYDEGQFFIDVHRLQEGVVKFDLRISSSYEDEYMLPFTVTFLPCDHSDTIVLRNGSCVDEIYWSEECRICGAVVDSGYEALGEHTWQLSSCTVATPNSSGYLGPIVCLVCGEERFDGRNIPASKVMQLPSSVRYIGAEAFMGTNAVQITVPEGVLEIDSMAFANNTDLLVLVLPESLNYIAPDALQGSNPIIVCGAFNSYLQEWALQNNLLVYPLY